MDEAAKSFGVKRVSRCEFSFIVSIFTFSTGVCGTATSYNAEHFLLIGAAEHARAGAGISAAAMS
jgi:hypothetical protein